MKYIYDKFYEQVKYAETKHSISLTLATALSIFSSTYLIHTSAVVTFLTACSIFFAILSAVFNFFALYDRKYNTKKKKGKLSDELLSYKNVAHFSREEYIKALSKKYKTKDEKLGGFEYDLVDQIIQTARSIKKKFEYFNYGITFLLASLVCEAGVIMCYYI